MSDSVTCTLDLEATGKHAGEIRVPNSPPVLIVSIANGDGQAPWTPERSAQRYQITGWGTPYFCVNARGQVEVTPDP